MYESVDQKEPIFDAKGIETVRRDTCKAVSTMLEKTIRIMFETKDASSVKQYTQRQWMKILKGRANMQDFIFAKEVKLGSYSPKGPLPPAAIVAKQAMQQDPRAEPLYRERVPYVVVYDGPNARLIDTVVDPIFFIRQSPNLQLNAVYYITKQIIPAMDRLFSLIGINVKSWYDELPKYFRSGGWRNFKQHIVKPDDLKQQQADERSKISSKTTGAATSVNTVVGRVKHMKTIDAYYGTRICFVCDKGICTVSSAKVVARYICKDCLSDKQQTSLWLCNRVRALERHTTALKRACMSCMGSYPNPHVTCVALECPVMFAKHRTTEQLSSAQDLLDMFATTLEKLDW